MQLSHNDQFLFYFFIESDVHLLFPLWDRTAHICCHAVFIEVCVQYYPAKWGIRMLTGKPKSETLLLALTCTSEIQSIMFPVQGWPQKFQTRNHTHNKG